MTPSVLILGSGAAGAAAALALTGERGVQVTFIDVGEQLADANQSAVDRLAAAPRELWSAADVSMIGEKPSVVASGGLPEKRSYGSDFPFRDVGQRAGVTSANHVNEAVISGAFGGFTNVWGAQLMPFTDETFRDWPVSSSEMRDAYTAILSEIPFAAEDDDLAGLFPLLAPAKPLPSLAPRSAVVLERYNRHRRSLNERGVTLGRARLALDSGGCVRCGMCMTGCPYRLIYSAAHTVRKLQRDDRITYRGGLLATSIEEQGDRVTVQARRLRDDTMHQFTADRVFVACGAIGSTRLALGSLGLYDRPVQVAESVQFVLPFFSARTVEDPRGLDDFTLNQFNMVVDLDRGYDVSQLHFYHYNPAFLANLPGPLRHPRAELARRAALRRLTVALGYLPSWASPTFQLTARPGGSGSLPDLRLSAERPQYRRNRFLHQVLRRVTAAAPALDLWPMLPALSMSKPAKSYHWGATFPHASRPSTPLSSDLLGRVGGWRRVHLVDASVFPTVPATTFTLTIMANSYRIARTVLRELD